MFTPPAHRSSDYPFLGFQTMSVVSLALLIFIFAESPWWVIAQGQAEEALCVLARLYAHDAVNEPFVIAEAAECRLSSVKRRCSVAGLT